MTSNLISTLIIVLVFVLWLLVMRKVFSILLAPIKTVRAEVVDKYQRTTSTKFTRTFVPDSFIVVFKANNKKLLFSVSEFSYKSYIIKDKGTLKYKGNRIISFE